VISLSKNSLPISLLAIALICFCVAYTVSYAYVTTPDLEAALGSLPPDEEIPVIVTLREKADLRNLRGEGVGPSRRLHRQKLIETLKGFADTSQIPFKALLKSRNAKNLRSLWINNGVAFSAPAHVIREIAGLPEVDHITVDYVLPAPVVIPGMAALSEWNIDAVGAPVLWNSGYTGQGIVIATMDTGVDVLHPDLNASWRGGTNSWFDPNNEHATPFDQHGHGTMSMGIIVGGSAGGSNIGMAPGAQWIAVKIFNDAGFAPLSAIHEGFQWLLDPDGNPATDDAPDVVNNSWGLDGSLNKCVTVFESDVQALKASGIAVVFSAGNSGPYPSSSISPANYPGSFAAGAVDGTLTIASFSSRGPSACDGRVYPEVVAPGVNVKTTDLTLGGLFPDSYATVSGTSFAAPHVAGAMALLLSAFPTLTIGELELALKQSALDLGIAGTDNTYGYGLIDVMEAYTLLFDATPDIFIDPMSHSYGNTKEGSSSPQRFTITNQGLLDLVIDAVTLTGPDVTEFHLQNDGCSMQTLAPTQTCTVEVVFSPASGGTKSASLSIPTNDPDETPLSVVLNGTGIEQFNLGVATTGTGTGRVVGMSRKIDCGPDCSELYAPGQMVTLQALTDSDSKFGGWSGCSSSLGTTCRVRMDKDKNVTATFIGPSLTLSSPNGGETLKAGSYHRIKWTFTGGPGPYIRIELLRGETVIKTIAKTAPRGSNGKGSFLWFVSRKLPDGADFRIRITSTRTVAAADISEGFFSIGR
jgi:serine protease AprX